MQITASQLTSTIGLLFLLVTKQQINTDAIHLIQKPDLASSICNWSTGLNAVFASPRLLNKLPLAGMSQKERGIFLDVMVPGRKCPMLFIIANVGNIFYAACPEVFSRAKTGALPSCLHFSRRYYLSQTVVCPSGFCYAFTAAEVSWIHVISAVETLGMKDFVFSEYSLSSSCVLVPYCSTEQ